MSDPVIRTDTAPPPVGPYPHARRLGPLLLLSGIGPRDPATGDVPGNRYGADGRLVAYDFEAQCRAVFRNVEAVLAAAGARREHLVDVTAFLTDLRRDFATFNRLYGEWLRGVEACRTTVGVSALPTPIAIELKCLAWLGER
ncbi:MAG: Rid family hydrolase [Xanthomonadales bacterium]|nr:Rid family hydrolase [Xanthomonadales bacterium]